MKRFSSVVVVLICFIFVSGCGQDSDYVVTIKTKYGDMVAILYDETPKHKENFIKLAKEHFFDSTLFHRVIEGFMIQGGDPESKTAVAGQPLGRGGPGYTVDAEFNPKLIHERGALSAARLGDEQNPTKASSGSQFYIVQGTVFTEAELTHDNNKFDQALQQYFKDGANKAVYDSIVGIYQSGDMQAYQTYIMNIKARVEKATGIVTSTPYDPEKLKIYTTVGGAPNLDGGYTVFGKVVKGMEVVDKIAAVECANERPVDDIRMSVTVEKIPKKKIEELYGYHYPSK